MRRAQGWAERKKDRFCGVCGAVVRLGCGEITGVVWR